VLQFQYTFATPQRKALCKPIATLDLATPPNAKFVLLLLLLQQFWIYRNTFGALKQGQNLVVNVVRAQEGGRHIPACHPELSPK
jgi:hypothetical protein